MEKKERFLFLSFPPFCPSARDVLYTLNIDGCARTRSGESLELGLGENRVSDTRSGGGARRCYLTIEDLQVSL